MQSTKHKIKIRLHRFLFSKDDWDIPCSANEYKGTLIVISHDETFLKEINIEREITL